LEKEAVSFFMFLGGEAVVGESVLGLEREAVELEREIGIL